MYHVILYKTGACCLTPPLENGAVRSIGASTRIFRWDSPAGDPRLDKVGDLLGVFCGEHE